MITHTTRILELLSDGPKLLEELGHQRGRVTYRISAINKFHKQIGSRWRIVGRRVHVPGPKTGVRLKSVLYRLVMEV